MPFDLSEVQTTKTSPRLGKETGFKLQEQGRTNCRGCGKDVTGARSFAFRPPGGAAIKASADAEGVIKCLTCSLFHRPMLKRSATASLVVGTILTLLNQGDLLLSAQWNDSFYWKIPLTYCVPFLVATYGALTNSRR